MVKIFEHGNHFYRIDYCCWTWSCVRGFSLKNHDESTLQTRPARRFKFFLVYRPMLLYQSDDQKKIWEKKFCLTQHGAFDYTEIA